MAGTLYKATSKGKRIGEYVKGTGAGGTLGPLRPAPQAKGGSPYAGNLKAPSKVFG